jgi:hypothetical protein
MRESSYRNSPVIEERVAGCVMLHFGLVRDGPLTHGSTQKEMSALAPTGYRGARRAENPVALLASLRRECDMARPRTTFPIPPQSQEPPFESLTTRDPPQGLSSPCLESTWEST